MIVVDLDGTLLSGNSLREFAKFLAKRSLKGMKFDPLARILFWLFLRRARLVSHKRMKWHLMKAADSLLQTADYEDFADILMPQLNPAVVDFIRDKDDCLLATAASAEYVEPLARRLKLDFVATVRPERFGDYREIRGQRKLEAVKGYKKPIEIVLTDHHDDLPLLLAAERPILVHPLPLTLMTVKASGLSPEIIY